MTAYVVAVEVPFVIFSTMFLAMFTDLIAVGIVVFTNFYCAMLC